MPEPRRRTRTRAGHAVTPATGPQPRPRYAPRATRTEVEPANRPAELPPDPEPIEPELPPLECPDGLPDLVADEAALAAAVRLLASGTGPLAVDTERASGYRYWPRAYLLQFARAGAGVVLIDPIACPQLGELAAALSDCEWIMHAASQDLPCLTELGLIPNTVFDTELAGRLLNLPRVGLATMVASLLGYSMAKGHSAEDWSARPLPESWLRYAALDVVPLVELRGVLADRLAAAGKDQWAHEEFTAALAAGTAIQRGLTPDPWRRTSGIHRVRTPRGLAIVAALWFARDEVARDTDTAPGRILPDSSIVAAGVAEPPTLKRLLGIREFHGRGRDRYRSAWGAALQAAWDTPADELPRKERAAGGPPPNPAWRRRDAAAADRLDRVRAVLARTAAEHDLPVENLLPPQVVRALAWQPPHPIDEGTVREALAGQGARTWQLELTTQSVTAALAGH